MNDDSHIKHIFGWQMTSYTEHIVEADIFIDCSGDSILAQLSGALYRHGRESYEEYGEEAAPEKPDNSTMGNSCLIQARETNRPIKFISPELSRDLSNDIHLENRIHAPNVLRNNYWWLELGGTKNTIYDSEEIRDDLIALAYGTWDHIKNHGAHDADNWELDFVGFLPGKRESRRCIGDHILTQTEVQNGGMFNDIIAYGGWDIDDHPPKGFEYDGEPNKNYPCPSPFGIPYRCLYSINIENLMFAGRNISVTHAAMAASRVMATCAIIGQAAGTAAFVAKSHNTTPRGANDYISEIQQYLMEDDCWIPGCARAIDEKCLSAELSGCCDNIENLRNGYDRPTDDNGDNGCFVTLNSSITYVLTKPDYVESVRIVFDSDLNRETLSGGISNLYDCPTICNRPFEMEPFTFPTTMTKAFQILVDDEVVFSQENNYQRLINVPIGRNAKKIELRPISTFGEEKAHIFSFDFR